MSASGWTVTLLLFPLFGSASSSPVSISTPAPSLPSQISPPSPFQTILPPPPSPSLSVPPSIPPLISNPGDPMEEAPCPLTISPSAVVVRFGDPVTANCSVRRAGFSLLGWEVSLVAPDATMDRFLVWSVDTMTDWNIKPMCYATSDMEGSCDLILPVIVYKPPDSVSISIVNHTGPMFEHHQYTLMCTVQDVAPIEHLSVTLYRGRTVLVRLQSKNTEKTPVTEIFTLNINPSKDDDGAQFWCEAELQLEREGQQRPLVVKSENLTATVLFGPQLLCPAKLQVRVGERLSCEVRGNPQPLVTWLKDGQVVVPPARSSLEHAGKYTVLAKGTIGQQNHTVEVEVVAGSRNAASCHRHFLLAVLLLHILNLL